MPYDSVVMPDLPIPLIHPIIRNSGCHPRGLCETPRLRAENLRPADVSGSSLDRRREFARQRRCGREDSFHASQIVLLNPIILDQQRIGLICYTGTAVVAYESRNTYELRIPFFKPEGKLASLWLPPHVHHFPILRDPAKRRASSGYRGAH